MRCGFGHAPDEYKNDPSVLKVSPSSIMEFLKSPAHYHARYIRGIKETTKAMEQGNIVHMAVLEEHRFLSEYACEPELINFPDALVTTDHWKVEADKLGLKKTGKKEELIARVCEADPSLKARDWDFIYKCHLAGRKPISLIDWSHVQELKASIEYHPKLKSLLARPGWREQLAWIFDEDRKILFKFKTDFVDDTGVIVDLKKCPSAQVRDFSRKIFFENLFVQGAMYFELWTILHEKYIPAQDEIEQQVMPIPKPRAFVFAAFEMKMPYIWQPYNLDAGALDAGEHVYVKAINRLIECREKNEWHGYSDKIEPISLPHYAWDILQSDADAEIDDGTEK